MAEWLTAAELPKKVFILTEPFCCTDQFHLNSATAFY